MYLHRQNMFNLAKTRQCLNYILDLPILNTFLVKQFALKLAQIFPILQYWNLIHEQCATFFSGMCSCFLTLPRHITRNISKTARDAQKRLLTDIVALEKLDNFYLNTFLISLQIL